jgi:hypothetical protein
MYLLRKNVSIFKHNSYIYIFFFQLEFYMFVVIYYVNVDELLCRGINSDPIMSFLFINLF